MEGVAVITEQVEKMVALIDHPILRFYVEEVSHEMKMCPCDDCDPCDYEAR